MPISSSTTFFQATTRNVPWSENSLLIIPEGSYQHVRGLIFGWSDFRNKAAIYNPTTRQSFQLPKMKIGGLASCFFGSDPLENQYKVLYLPLYYMEQACQVFTLGDPKAKQWRTIQGVGSHQFPLSGAVCINGVIYYIAKAQECDYPFTYKLMSFVVRSEKFRHVEDAPETLKDHISYLINYQGKLGFVVCCKKDVEVWVREDGDHKTQGWSKIFFYERKGFEIWSVSCVTRDGEIVFNDWNHQHDDTLCVLYYDPKLNSVRYVDFVGTYPKERRRHNTFYIWTIPDYVENTMLLY